MIKTSNQPTASACHMFFSALCRLEFATKALVRGRCLTLILLLGIVITTSAQQDSAKQKNYEDLSLKELLNVPIVSASKSSEFLFDAPLSASVITKEEIRRSGSTSIMEALRLLPGLIVREQSNGNYDIHIRGMDNIPPNAAFDIVSTTILVMIDNRPIYSYLRGGTFWETLPVDLNDVEKIEVVRGPAAALYGPNAVNGVINIITRRPSKDGLYAVANAQQGTHHSFINNVSLGFKNDQWSLIASGNYQGRNRAQTSYFEFYRHDWFELGQPFRKFLGDTVKNMNERYPDQHMAMEKYAGNVFFHYKPANRTEISISAGLQDSKAQNVRAENEVTPLSTALSKSQYVDLRTSIHQLNGQFSLKRGIQVTDSDPGNKYNFSIFDANLEYQFGNRNLTVKPGLSYRNAVYDDTDYSDTARKTGVFNARGNIATASASLRLEYKLFDNKLRLVAGLAASKFNYPDTTYASYQLAATYKANDKHLFRIVYSMAPRSSTVFDTYVDQTIAFYPTGFRKFTRRALAGNRELKLLTAHLLEAGYRGMLGTRFSIDLEVFHIQASHFNALISSRASTEIRNTDTISVYPIRVTNLPLSSSQYGMTVSIQYSTAKWLLKPFVTVQSTTVRDYAPYGNTPDAPDAVPGKDIYAAMGSSLRLNSTPAVFGGASVNFIPAAKWNLNLQLYYYTSQEYYHLTNVLFHDGIRGIDQIKGKMLVNTRVSFQPKKGLQLFCSGRNLLNDRSREFFKSDIVPFRLMAGINYEL